MKENQNKLNYIIYCVLAVTPLIIMPWSLDRSQKPKITFVYLMVLLGLPLLVKLYKEGHLKFQKSYIYLLILTVLIGIATNMAENVGIAFYGNVYRESGYLSILAYFILFVYASISFEVDSKLMKLVAISVFLVSIYGILQYFDLDFIPRDMTRINWKKRAFSTMGNPNFFGAYLSLFVPVSFVYYLDSKKSLVLVYSLVLYVALLLSMTRSSWVGIFFTLIFIVIKKGLHSKEMTRLLISLVVVSFVVNEISGGVVFGRSLSTILDFRNLLSMEENFESGGSGRIFIWKRVIELIKIKPFFGFGPEQLGDAFDLYFGQEVLERHGRVLIYDMAHNEYLHMAVTTGLPSLFVYLGFLFHILKHGLKKLDDPFVFAIFCAVISYLIQAFFNISVVSVAYIFWIFLGILVKKVLN